MFSFPVLIKQKIFFRISNNISPSFYYFSNKKNDCNTSSCVFIICSSRFSNLLSCFALSHPIWPPESWKFNFEILSAPSIFFFVCVGCVHVVIWRVCSAKAGLPTCIDLFGRNCTKLETIRTKPRNRKLTIFHRLDRKCGIRTVLCHFLFFSVALPKVVWKKAPNKNATPGIAQKIDITMWVSDSHKLAKMHQTHLHPVNV